MKNVDYIDEANLVTEEEKEMLTRLIHFTLEKENINFNYEVSMSFVTNEEIKLLNKSFREIDKKTDVLSFPLIEDFSAEFSENIHPIGDVVISIDQAKEQADTYNHTFKREIAFLTVHSLLHLLGYTHDTEAEEKEMFSRQEYILKEFGIERE